MRRKNIKTDRILNYGNLIQKMDIFLYIGSRGQDGIPEFKTIAKGGWGGGGDSGKDTIGEY